LPELVLGSRVLSNVGLPDMEGIVLIAELVDLLKSGDRSHRLWNESGSRTWRGRASHKPVTIQFLESALKKL